MCPCRVPHDDWDKRVQIVLRRKPHSGVVISRVSRSVMPADSTTNSMELVDRRPWRRIRFRLVKGNRKPMGVMVQEPRCQRPTPQPTLLVVILALAVVILALIIIIVVVTMNPTTRVPQTPLITVSSRQITLRSFPLPVCPFNHPHATRRIPTFLGFFKCHLTWVFSVIWTDNHFPFFCFFFLFCVIFLSIYGL